MPGWFHSALRYLGVPKGIIKYMGSMKRLGIPTSVMRSNLGVKGFNAKKMVFYHIGHCILLF